jgi:RNA polymerase sigma-70 factor (ECF subfamily)
VANRASVGAIPNAQGHPALVDGVPGVLITTDGRPFVLMAFTVQSARITKIRLLTAPERLAQLVPSWFGVTAAEGTAVSRRPVR